MFPVCKDVEIISLPLPERTFNICLPDISKFSVTLGEKQIALTYPLSKLCRKEEICLLPFGEKIEILIKDMTGGGETR